MIQNIQSGQKGESSGGSTKQTGIRAGAPPALAVDNITVTYANGFTALHDASFILEDGTICALVGVNGSGKSTMFKAIMGFVQPVTGKIEIGGEPATLALRRNRVAYVPQSEDVDWNFPVLVEDVVMMGRYGYMGFLRLPSSRDRAKVNEALARVNMNAFRRRQIGELSGGQKKRVFLARALAQEADLILLDEPFTGIDVKTEAAIVKLLQELRDDGKTILVSTHNLGSVPEFCDQVVLIKGTVIAAGPTATTFTQANLQAAFGGVLRQFQLGGEELHDDDDERAVTVLTDDERPVIFYGTGRDASEPRRRPKGQHPDSATGKDKLSPDSEGNKGGKAPQQ